MDAYADSIMWPWMLKVWNNIEILFEEERQTIMNIPSFIARDWDRLLADILKLYNADLATKHYKLKTLGISQGIRKRKMYATVQSGESTAERFFK